MLLHPISATIKALTNLKIKKIAVLTPYPQKVNKTIFDYITKSNIEITSFSSFNLEYDSEIASVDPKYLIETVNACLIIKMLMLFLYHVPRYVLLKFWIK